MPAIALREVALFIQQTTDPSVLRQIVLSCNQRREVLETSAYEKQREELWEKLSDVKNGDLLYVTAEKLSVGGRFPKNSVLHVNSVDQVKKEINVSSPGGENRTLGLIEIHRFRLSKQPVL